MNDSFWGLVRVVATLFPLIAIPVLLTGNFFIAFLFVILFFFIMYKLGERLSQIIGKVVLIVLAFAALFLSMYYKNTFSAVCSFASVVILMYTKSEDI